LKTPSPKKVPDSQLQKLVDRLLQSNKPETDTPVIISTIGGEYCSSVGRLVERAGALVSAVVDVPMEREREVTVFLPENAYVAEVRNCVAHEEQFKIELVLIQAQANEPNSS
jgi:hypothetical protein